MGGDYTIIRRIFVTAMHCHCITRSLEALEVMLIVAKILLFCCVCYNSEIYPSELYPFNLPARRLIDLFLQLGGLTLKIVM